MNQAEHLYIPVILDLEYLRQIYIERNNNMLLHNYYNMIIVGHISLVAAIGSKTVIVVKRIMKIVLQKYKHNNTYIVNITTDKDSILLEMRCTKANSLIKIEINFISTNVDYEIYFNIEEVLANFENCDNSNKEFKKFPDF